VVVEQVKVIIRVISGVALAAKLIPWFYPDEIEVNHRLIITLVVVVFIAGINYAELWSRHRKQTEELEKWKAKHDDRKKRHTALGRQYDMKKMENDEYKKAVSITQRLLAIAIARKKDQKIDELAAGIMLLFNNIEKEL